MESKIKELKMLKEKKLEQLKAKKQYFEEITIQASLLKRLVRRNFKVEDEDTSANIPDKAAKNQYMLERYQETKKIHLPMLVLEFAKDSDFEIMINEDHNNVIILSDTHWNLYNDNHVLLQTGLLNEDEQKNIEYLYETEVKPIRK